HVVRNHCKLRQQSRILDVNELFQHAERWGSRAVGDGTSDGVPSSVEQQPVAAIHRCSMLQTRKTPKPHQAAAPQAILPRMVSITRAPASVCAMFNGVSPPSSAKPLRSHLLAFSTSPNVSSASD